MIHELISFRHFLFVSSFTNICFDFGSSKIKTSTFQKLFLLCKSCDLQCATWNLHPRTWFHRACFQFEISSELKKVHRRSFAFLSTQVQNTHSEKLSSSIHDGSVHSYRRPQPFRHQFTQQPSNQSKVPCSWVHFNTSRSLHKYDS